MNCLLSFQPVNLSILFETSYYYASDLTVVAHPLIPGVLLATLKAGMDLLFFPSSLRVTVLLVACDTHFPICHGYLFSSECEPCFPRSMIFVFLCDFLSLFFVMENLLQLMNIMI